MNLAVNLSSLADKKRFLGSRNLTFLKSKSATTSATHRMALLTTPETSVDQVTPMNRIADTSHSRQLRSLQLRR